MGDGDLILTLGTNTKPVMNALRGLASRINNLFGSNKGQTNSPQLEGLILQAEQSAHKIEELKQQIESMRNTKIETPDFQKLNVDLDTAKQKLQNLIDTKYKGLDFSNVKSVKDLPKDLYDVANEINQIQVKINSLKASGQDFTTQAQQQPKAFEKVNEQLRQEEIRFAQIQGRINEINNSAERTPNRLFHFFSTIGNGIDNIFKRIRNNSSKTSKQVSRNFDDISGTIRKGLKLLLKYGLGMRSFFFLFRRLRRDVMTSYKDLATYSDEVNSAISGTKSALTKLKNSIAAAIQPIVQVLAPIITNLANKMANAVNMAAQFFAALTGQGYVFQAIDVQESYADSLDETADNADKATKALKRYLSPLDDLNRFDSNSDTDSSATPKFAQNNINSNFQTIANNVREYFKDIFKPIKDAWDKYGKGVIEEWNLLLLNIKGVIKDIAVAFRNVWMDGSGERVSGNIFKIWKDILGIINAIIGTFREAWNKDALGEKVIRSFTDRFEALLGFIHNVASTFKEVWESGVGERVWGNILGIVKSINDIIGGFWGKLSEAWEANNNGHRIWESILTLVEKVSGFIKSIFDTTAEWVKDIDFSPIMETLSPLIDAFTHLWEVLSTKLKGVYEDVLLPLAKWTIEKAVPVLIELLGGALDFLAGVLDKIPQDVFNALAAGILSIYAAFKVASTVGRFTRMITSAFSAISSHPAVASFMLIAGGITAIITAIKSYNNYKWQNSSLKKEVDRINEFTLKIKNSVSDIKSSIESVNESNIQVTADITQVETLKDRLKEIIRDGVISKEEMPEYKTLLDLLRTVDGFEDTWNSVRLEEINGTINVNTDEAIKKLDEWEDTWKQALMKSTLQGVISDLYSSRAKNQIDVKEAEENVKKLGKEFIDVYKEGEGWISRYSSITDDQILNSYYNAYIQGREVAEFAGEEFKSVYEAYASARKELEDYNNEWSKQSDIIDKTESALYYLNGQTDNYAGLLYLVEQGWISEAEAVEYAGVKSIQQIQDLATKTSNSMEDTKTVVHNSFDDMWNGVDDFKTKLQQDGLGKTINDELTSYKNPILNTVNAMANAASEAFKKVQFNTMLNNLFTPLNTVRTALGGKPINIPKLASGAVIPAGRPFMAMLGDQSSGRNLEAPENLIRQIVREETANLAGGNKTYTIPVQVGSRNLLTIVLDEAKLEQMQAGYNPFVQMGTV